MVHTTGRYGEHLVIEGIQGRYGWPVLGRTFDYLTDTHAFGYKMRARYGEVYQLCIPQSLEFAKYWFHRLGHEHPKWWPLHSVHHSVKRMHLLNGFRIHPLYHLCTFLLGVVPCYLIGASEEALIINSVILAIGGSIQHCNIKLRYGWLNYIFNTNELHRWHHSKNISEGNTNYGAVLIVYDVLFGTHYYRPDAEPLELGISDEERYPMNNYWKQLLIPFRWKSQILDK